METPAYNVWVTYVVTYIMYGLLTFIFYRTWRLGRIARQAGTDAATRRHRAYAWAFVIFTPVSMLTVRQVGLSDDMIYVPDPVLKVHVYAFFLFFGCAIASLVFTGRRYKLMHRWLGIGILAGYIFTVGTGIMFTHFSGKTETISAVRGNQN